MGRSISPTSLASGALLLALSLLHAEDTVRLTPTRIVSMAYPRPALLAGIQGSVEVLCDVSANGEVTEATPLGGHPLLAKPVAANAKRWTFDTHGTSVTTKLVYRFLIGTNANSEFVFDEPNRITVSSVPISLNPHSERDHGKE